ncbi:hypothetical protein LptCag_1761 [Leptospirillum ferriphilum]|jgi:hypothetical protein|uniref:Uncharacterized protein n=2 Tax=Leptospirillum ferriphilum TaxID=178606 RepID=A0A094WAE9_9BACT|nr:hypothetical protein [Leptospirillum ferriphilum]AFS53969.1 hypothetical protein LFML04_1769 [Leptospirillum ferriphilum ML-04]KGA92617.1 hypothetical protein LptCag_1761 [Leptospirillum ferriphilum]OOH73627.1 hypothetical protein BOX24_03890 [Leptospirillum ferriphilum]
MIDERSSDLELVSSDSKGYVIIRYRDLYVGIAKNDLKIDPFVEYLGDCFLSPRVLVANNLEILQQRMNDARMSRNDQNPKTGENSPL